MTPLAVDEARFLEKTFDFSPPEEKPLDERLLVPPETPFPFPEARFEVRNGVSTIVVNGTAVPSLARAVVGVSGAPVERMLRESGVRLFIVDVGLTADYQEKRPLANAPNDAFAQFERRARELLAAVPDAVLFVRLWMTNVNEDYVAMHPSGLLAGENGQTDWGHAVPAQAGHTRRPNMLNEWRRFCGEHLRRFVHRLGSSPYAERVAGFYIGAMNTGEWWYYKGRGDPGWDYSPTRKAATGGKSLVGMELHIGGITYPTNGTVFLNHLLDAPEIDFFGGPSEYGGRQPGSSPLYRVIYSSLAQHGKFWLNEGDYRTHTAYDTRSGAAGHATRTSEQTRHVLLREYARGVVFNYLTYLMDFGWFWFHDLHVKETATRLMEIDRLVRHTGVHRAPEIALVTDQESQRFGNYFANPIILTLAEMDRLGAPWDFYELRDILQPGVADRYKLIIFLNIRSLAEHERKAIDRLKSNGRVLLWMHDPGVVDLTYRGTKAAELMSRLIGMEMKAGSAPKRIALHPTAFARIQAPLPDHIREIREEPRRKTRTNKEVSLSDASEGLPIGNIPSRYYCVDPEAVLLGTDPVGRGFMAARKYPEWTSVYAAYCRLAPEILRAFAQKAGCHRWSESNDILFASENYLAIHAAKDGEKTVRLPKTTGVLDLLSGTIVSPATNKITLSMKEGETRFFYLGDAAEAKARLEAEQTALQQEVALFRTLHPAPSCRIAFFENHKPRPPAGTGIQPLTGQKRLQPPALLVAGPFPSDPESVKTVDARLANLREITEWQPLPLPDSAISRQSDTFLQVLRPLPLRNPDESAFSWYGIATAYSWMSQEKLGMATGQTYAVAFNLQSATPATVRLCVDTAGKSAVWVDGVPTPPQSDLAVGPERKLVVVRVTGGKSPTGIGVKIYDGTHPNSIRDRISPPESVVSWIPEQNPKP